MAKTFEEQFYIFLNQQKKLLADLQAIIENGITANVPEPLQVDTGLEQPLTNAELRATPIEVEGTVSIDTTGLATSDNQVSQTNLLTTIDGYTSNLDVLLSTRLKAADTLAGVSDVRQSVAANLNMTEASAAAIKTNTDSIVTPTAVYNGKTTVTTAGTRVALASSQTVKSVTVKALSTNTGFIYVGNSSVANTNGFQLKAGDTVSLDLSNLATVYIDSSVNGEGITYIANN